ncbi:hypothetical protein TELCIR_07855 [Teladorsagia circumcincta]|uniref:Uncharacterized protein n=1 Tax=Teladorsagia circumcincta TaxID=45464 RepID=A0A2G9UJG3_TELCI|nr:hypothetical protein TELCIR_07855 [Teladorsagia circumcincta]
MVPQGCASTQATSDTSAATTAAATSESTSAAAAGSTSASASGSSTTAGSESSTAEAGASTTAESGATTESSSSTEAATNATTAESTTPAASPDNKICPSNSGMTDKAYNCTLEKSAIESANRCSSIKDPNLPSGVGENYYLFPKSSANSEVGALIEGNDGTPNCSGGRCRKKSDYKSNRVRMLVSEAKEKLIILGTNAIPRTGYKLPIAKREEYHTDVTDNAEHEFDTKTLLYQEHKFSFEIKATWEHGNILQVTSSVIRKQRTIATELTERIPVRENLNKEQNESIEERTEQQMQ